MDPKVFKKWIEECRRNADLKEYTDWRKRKRDVDREEAQEHLKRMDEIEKKWKRKRDVDREEAQEH